MAERKHTLRVGGMRIAVGNSDKRLYPADGISKGRVVDYYHRIAAWALPHARDRFLTLHRFPDGIGAQGFVQQQRSDHFPPRVAGVSAPLARGGRLEHMVIRDAAGLVCLAEQATLTFHGWLSRQDRPDRPDRLVIDLDPPGNDFALVREAARALRAEFEALELTPFVMTTGSRGLHVVVPLDRKATFEDARRFALALTRRLVSRERDWLTVEQRKDRRRGRLYLDLMRNAYGQTAVLPYSLRAKAGAPVATPLRWEEVSRAGLEARSYHLGNIFRRLARIDDPWKALPRCAGNLARAQRALDAAG